MGRNVHGRGREIGKDPEPNAGSHDLGSQR